MIGPSSGGAPLHHGDRPVRVVARVTTRSSLTPATNVLPVEQYVAGLTRRRMAAGVLLRDCAGRVLVVEPSYKPNWELPGGAVEADESPWAAATRELGGGPGAELPSRPVSELRAAHASSGLAEVE